MFPFLHDPDHPAQPLSDEQTKAQVVNPAKQISRTANLQNVSAVFGWESCNDQGDPPYRGRADISFDIPAGTDSNTYFGQIAAAMVAQGWSEGPPPGMRFFGRVIHADGVMAIIGKSGGTIKAGSVELSGECRNIDDHRHDGKWYDVTDQLLGA
ncbi:hypothetical protein [Mycobacterium pseudokansasii]|uniref:Lipoprotein LppJ n=1 Tax=Mycobacterium pseudokansasii TaxID=2341080 RepID=A0A498QUI4_9MYCO|nr:hypothetical protein [Mycobacterium pseudokansasii]VBA51756.1 Putative lipoprotein LppJ [Mycobacterium pseudokansasii]